MTIIGVDYHPEFQQIALVDTNTGDFSEARLQNPGAFQAPSCRFVEMGRRVQRVIWGVISTYRSEPYCRM